MEGRKSPIKRETLKRGSITAALYHTSKVVNGKRYPTFRLAYFEPGKGRRIRDFATREKAKAVFDEFATAYALGRPSALSWSESERAEYDAATQALKGTGLGVYGAVQKLLEASSVSFPDRTVSQVVAELVADREGAECSEEHVRDIAKRLDPFAKAFQCQIRSVTSPLVREYLTHLRGAKGQPLTARSRDNARRMIVTLFNFARQQKYIPKELAEDIAEIPGPSIKPKDIEVFTAENMTKILEASTESDRVLMAFGAFAGLRTSELHRLDWENVKFEQRLVVVTAEKAKTKRRRNVPISDNLAEWIRPHAQASGRISRHTHEHALSWALMKIARGAGVRWVKNGLRHSFCSYRLAIVKSMPQVALEAGNSPAVIEKHYDAVVTEAEGKAWFSILPTPGTFAPNDRP